jgi:hypothetical protein
MVISDARDPSADETACGIRDVVTVMTNDLVTVQQCTGDLPGCADAVRRLVRQVHELHRLADELHLPPG